MLLKRAAGGAKVELPFNRVSDVREVYPPKWTSIWWFHAQCLTDCTLTIRLTTP